MAQARVSKLDAKAAERRRMGEVLRILKREYSEAECSLTHRNPFELLMATILSAQCTDERVNQVTPALFERYPTPQAMAGARITDLERLVRTTGFFKNKARALKECSQGLVEEHGGEVPRELEALTHLRGVGRKTANVVRGVAFGIPSLVVDTHVTRLTYRLGFTKSTDAVKIEHEMQEIVPESDWVIFAHLLISHGRKVCTARAPRCEECPIARLCPKVGVAVG